MSDKPKDGSYTFKAGETLPDWCSFSPGAKIESGGVKCRVYNGTAGDWKVFDNTRIEGDYYLYNEDKKVGKIHIKEKRRIRSEGKRSRKSFDKTLLLWLFYGLAFLIFIAVFIINHP